MAGSDYQHCDILGVGAEPTDDDADAGRALSPASTEKPLTIWTNFGPSPAVTRAELEVIETYFADLLDEVLAAEP